MALGKENLDETYWMLWDLVVMTGLVENIKGKYKDQAKSETCDELGTYIPVTWNTCTKRIRPLRQIKR